MFNGSIGLRKYCSDIKEALGEAELVMSKLEDEPAFLDETEQIHALQCMDFLKRVTGELIVRAEAAGKDGELLAGLDRADGADGVSLPGPQINMPAWAFCVSWYVDLECRVTSRLTGPTGRTRQTRRPS